MITPSSMPTLSGRPRLNHPRRHANDTEQGTDARAARRRRSRGGSSRCRSMPCCAAAKATDAPPPAVPVAPAQTSTSISPEPVKRGDQRADDRAAQRMPPARRATRPRSEQLGTRDRRVQQPETLGGRCQHRPEQPADGQRDADGGRERRPRQDGARGQAGSAVCTARSSAAPSRSR